MEFEIYDLYEQDLSKDEESQLIVHRIGFFIVPKNLFEHLKEFQQFPAVSILIAFRFQP